MTAVNDKKQFYNRLKTLVIPIAIQSFMLSLVSATDAAMLGLVDQDPMAAASQAGQIQFFLNLLIMGITIGVGIMTAQYWGKKDVKTIEEIAPTGLKLLLLVGGGMTLVALIFPAFLMRILTNDASLIKYGADYLRAVAPSYFLCAVSQIYFSLLKNTGFTGKCSVISCSAVVINIILNAILIFGLLGAPKMGVQGAALATVITRAIELVCVVIVTKKYGHVQLRWSRLFKRMSKLLFKDYVRYTTPVIGAGLVWGIACIFYNIYLGHMGSDAVAANSIISVVRNLISCLIKGISGGTSIMIGNLLGANELDKAKRYGIRLVKLAIFVGACTSVVLVLLYPVMIRFVSLTETAQYYLRIMLAFSAFHIVAGAINTTVFDGLFAAGGDSKFDMKCNIFIMWCFTVPFGALAAFVFKWPAPLVYCLVNLDEFIKLPAVYIHFRKYVWLRNITRDSE